MLSAVLSSIFDLRRTIFILGLIGWSLSYSDQASILPIFQANPNQSVLTACVMHLDHTCSNTPKIALYRTVKKTEVTRKSPSLQHITVPACLPTSPSYYEYVTSSTQAMNTLNANADRLRSAAASNGEGYQVFEAQMNSLFDSYDTKVNKLYQGYLAQNNTCQPIAKTPVIFQMFP